MKSLFLRLKHWQLFILFFVLPMIIYMITIIAFVAKMIALRNPNNMDPSMFSGLIIGISIMSVLTLGTLSIWNWSVGTKLIEQVPSELRLNNRFFKFSVIFQFVYMLIIPLLMFQTFSSIDFHSHQPPNINPFLFLLIIPFHLFTIFCSFYNVYFTAKTIKTALLKRELTFGDYVGEFFLILFLFIGVWIVQPKTNRLIEPESEF